MKKFSLDLKSFGKVSSLEVYKNLENTPLGITILNTPKEQRESLLNKMIGELEFTLAQIEAQKLKDQNSAIEPALLNQIVEKYYFYEFAWITFFKKFREEKNRPENLEL